MNKNHWVYTSVRIFYRIPLSFSYNHHIYPLEVTFCGSNRPWSNWSEFQGSTVKFIRKTSSKGNNINTDLIEYVLKIVVKERVRKNLNMLIILLKLSKPYICLFQRHYQIHITIQDHELIAIELIYQHIPVQTKMYFLMKLFVHMTIQHHIYCVGFYTRKKQKIIIICLQMI